MNTIELPQVTPSGITPAPEGTTYTVAGKEFPIIGYTDFKGKAVPLVDIPMMSDYKWQYNCLMDRIEDPEKYAATGEDVMAKIEHLKKWLVENRHKANPNDPIYNEDIAVKISA